MNDTAIQKKIRLMLGNVGHVLRPRWEIEEARMCAIECAVEKQLEEGKSIPVAWIHEHSDLLKSPHNGVGNLKKNMLKIPSDSIQF